METLFISLVALVYSIIPQPQEVKNTDALLNLPQQSSIAYSKSLKSEASQLQSYLWEDFAWNTQLKHHDKKAMIRLVLDKKIESPRPNGYHIIVNNQAITLTAASNAGIFYGIQSLRQMIQAKKKACIIAQGEVTDYPAFSWRSFMLDEARHFKGMKVVKNLLDEMAYLKLNTFQWHLTDSQGWRIEIKKYPKLTEIGAYRDSTEVDHFGSNKFDGKPHRGYYTKDEIREVIAYAAERHITIVPEIEMPGHASAAIAAYPFLNTAKKQINVPCKFGVQYSVFNVVSPKVMNFLVDVLTEVKDLFPSPVIHVGGDEIRYNEWKESEEVQAYMKEHGLKTPAELQVDFTNRISNIVASMGKRMMGWNDITGDKLHSYQSTDDTDEMKQKLDPSTIIQFWKGDPKLMIKSIDKGFDIVNSYHVFTYLDYNYKSIPLSKAYSFNPIPKGLPKDKWNKVLGMGCQMWGEFIPTVKDMNRQVFPRLAAYAECGWTKFTNKDFNRFEQAIKPFEARWRGLGYIE